MVTTDCEWHRPKRFRVFHAQPFSSFSRNYFKDRRWVRGSPFTEERPRNGIIKKLKFRFFFSNFDFEVFWTRRAQFWGPGGF